jgi:hypothetical protein
MEVPLQLGGIRLYNLYLLHPVVQANPIGYLTLLFEYGRRFPRNACNWWRIHFFISAYHDNIQVFNKEVLLMLRTEINTGLYNTTIVTDQIYSLLPLYEKYNIEAPNLPPKTPNLTIDKFKNLIEEASCDEHRERIRGFWPKLAKEFDAECNDE